MEGAVMATKHEDVDMINELSREIDRFLAKIRAHRHAARAHRGVRGG